VQIWRPNRPSVPERSAIVFEDCALQLANVALGQNAFEQIEKV
jgi:hypothetical protein